MRIAEAIRRNCSEGAAWVREERARFGPFDLDGEYTVDLRQIVLAITRAWNPVFRTPAEWTDEGIVLPPPVESYQMPPLSGEQTSEKVLSVLLVLMASVTLSWVFSRLRPGTS